MKTYYDLLAVPNTATKDEIKIAYLRKMKTYHPDVFKGKQSLSQEFSAKLNQAYNTLKDNEKRLAYDKTIFPKTYTQNYQYDKNGNRLPVFLNKTNANNLKNENLPAFSFFEKSKLSENLKAYFALSKAERKRLRQNKKQANQLKKQSFKKLNKQERLEKKQKKQSIKQEKKELVSLKGKNQSIDESSKRKLNISIAIVFGLLLTVFGVLAYLRVTYS